jgi:hypothetical protein
MSTIYGSTKTISLTYDGYWRETNAAGVPNQSGVYSAYACTYNRQAETVSIRELIYIGESEHVRDRIHQHLAGATGSAWKRRLRPGEELCFSYAPVGQPDRERAEAALIYKHKPPANTEYVDHFPAKWSPTTIGTSGKNALLSSQFTVR